MGLGGRGHLWVAVSTSFSVHVCSQLGPPEENPTDCMVRTQRFGGYSSAVGRLICFSALAAGNLTSGCHHVRVLVTKHCLITDGRPHVLTRREERARSAVSSYRTPTLMASSKPGHVSTIPACDTVPSGITASAREFGVGDTAQSSAIEMPLLLGRLALDLKWVVHIPVRLS